MIFLSSDDHNNRLEPRPLFIRTQATLTKNDKAGMNLADCRKIEEVLGVLVQKKVQSSGLRLNVIGLVGRPGGRLTAE